MGRGNFMKSKIIAVVLSVSTLLLCMPSGSAIADMSASESSQEYVLYSKDLVTGEEGDERIPISDGILDENVSNYISNGISEGSNDGGISPNAYIGEDDSYEIIKTSEMPYRSVCNLKTYWDNNGDGVVDFTSGGSGCMIGRRMLLTAAHVIYNENRGGKCIGVDVYPAQTRYYTPYGPYKAIKFFVNADYREKINTDDDWGLVILDDCVGDRTGWLDLKNCTNISMIGKEVSVIGYPGGKDPNRITMWRSDGKVIAEYTDALRYDCDTTGGCSGGPVIDSNNNIVAIHHGGVTDSYNAGAKVDDFICRVADVLGRMYNQ